VSEQVSRTVDQSHSREGYPLKTSLIGWAVSILLRGIALTLRWNKTGLYQDDQHWSEGEPVILAFWHGDQLFMPWSYFSPKSSKKRSIKALVSLHGDGRVAAAALGFLSIKTIDGSSSRGGSRALVLLKKELQAGNHVGITPDGPKGPIHEAKVGAALLSSMTGAPILPIALACDRYWQLKSWDKMFIPKPFSKITLIVGSPMDVPQGLKREELTEHSEALGKSLNELKLQAQEGLS
jgi:lysophospholipid acyltransferase (LPLAT)-like uncharacterized protein